MLATDYTDSYNCFVRTLRFFCISFRKVRCYLGQLLDLLLFPGTFSKGNQSDSNIDFAVAAIFSGFEKEGDQEALFPPGERRSLKHEVEDNFLFIVRPTAPAVSSRKV